MSGYMAFFYEKPHEYTKKVMDMDWTMVWEVEDGDENPFDLELSRTKFSKI